MRVACVGCVYGKSIEDYPICMATTIDKLIELRRIPRVALAGTREYEYDFDQVRLLYEIANAIIRINEEKLVSASSVFIGEKCDRCVAGRLEILRKILTDLKYDPIDAYRRLVREMRHVGIKLSKTGQDNSKNPDEFSHDTNSYSASQDSQNSQQAVGENSKRSEERSYDTNSNLLSKSYDTEQIYEMLYPDEEIVEEPAVESCADCYSHYLGTMAMIKEILDKCSIIQRYVHLKEKGELKEKTGDRGFYRKIFHPTTKPNFMYTRFMISPPAKSELIERYKVGDADVGIYKIPGKDRKLYHIIPPEFNLTEQEYAILEKGRKYLGTHAPREGEATIESERFRENMFTLSLDMVKDIAKVDELEISEERLKELANILARYTAGLGILELFLKDEKIQDIVVNSPIERIPVYIVHSDYFECETNIIPSYEDAESWATRFKLESGRPLDEANPVLDTELIVKGGRARVAAISRPLSPDGLAFAFRRHRDRPWTYPLFIKNRMMDAFSAGLIWFLIDGSRSMLIGGTRSSGKSSFLGASLVQIMPKTRILTSEDTLELPVVQLRELGYNIARLKSRSVITKVETELPAEEALRTALRLGDSALILGEVRSLEAISLFEAMRIGALANVVAGTIHGESAYGVFDRVVNDLHVPKTSFKAMDIVMICNNLRSPDGMRSYRRLVELTEIRKHWTDDPMREGGFVNLLEYSAKDDMLKPSNTLLVGESEVLNDIASRVREWKGRWDNVWSNIILRQDILAKLTEYGRHKPELIESDFVVKSNMAFHLISADAMKEVGAMDSKLIFERWLEWLKKWV